MRRPSLRVTACMARVYGRLQWPMQTRLPRAEHRNRVGQGGKHAIIRIQHDMAMRVTAHAARRYEQVIRRTVAGTRLV
jgi:hypothetical protein